VKIGVFLSDEPLALADSEATRRGTSRWGLLAELLDEARIRERIRRSIDEHGWDVAENDDAWRLVLGL
jgi:hypothetical protein